MISPLYIIFSGFLCQQTHNMLNYYQVRHCIIQLLSVWMSQDMPTPLSCLSFLSVFLFFSSPLSHLIMILFCLNNDFFFLGRARGQSLSNTLSLYFPPRHLISSVFSPVCSALLSFVLSLYFVTFKSLSKSAMRIYMKTSLGRGFRHIFNMLQFSK